MVAYKILRIESEFPRKNRKDKKVHYTPELSSKEEHEIKKVNRIKSNFKLSSYSQAPLLKKYSKMVKCYSAKWK